MKAGHVAAIYGVSVLGAAAVSYMRGRQGTEILFDAALHGALVGTGLAIVGYFVLPDGEVVPVVARPNFFGSAKKNVTDGMGTINPKGVQILELVDSSMFQDTNKNGMTIISSPDPDKYNIIQQAP